MLRRIGDVGSKVRINALRPGNQCKGKSMKVFGSISFRNDESGAITVDWVVLTGAIVGISFGVVATVFGFLDAAQTQITGEMQVDLN